MVLLIILLLVGARGAVSVPGAFAREGHGGAGRVWIAFADKLRNRAAPAGLHLPALRADAASGAGRGRAGLGRARRVAPAGSDANGLPEGRPAVRKAIC